MYQYYDGLMPIFISSACPIQADTHDAREEPNVQEMTVKRADWRPLARSGAFEAEVWSMLADDEMGEDQLSVLDYR